MEHRIALTTALLLASSGASAATSILSMPDFGGTPQMTFVDLALDDGITPHAWVSDPLPQDHYGKSDGENGAILEFGYATPAGPGVRARSFTTGQLAYSDGFNSSKEWTLSPRSAVTLTFPMYASVSAGTDGRAMVSYWLTEDVGFQIWAGGDFDDGVFRPATSVQRDLKLNFTNLGDTPMLFSWGDSYSISARGGDLVAPVPEPETYALMALGLGVVGWWARRRQGHGSAGTGPGPRPAGPMPAV